MLQLCSFAKERIMVVFHPSLTQIPSGRMHSYIGDTIKREFLNDPSTAEAVLGSIGIRREPYERAQSEEEIKTLLFNDTNKLKSYLSGPGMTDNRFKEGVRDQVNRRFGTTVINGIQKQNWQQFILRTDDITEYERMKANIGNFKTGALYSSYRLDDENMAVVIEATNTVMTLDKQLGDDSVRVANMKGKEGKPLNYSENNLYGSIADNSNWIAGDIYSWMRESGFENDQMISERKFEMGAKPKSDDDRPVSFKEGKRHAIEFLQKETSLHQRALAELSGMGVLVGESEIVVDEPVVDADEIDQNDQYTEAEVAAAFPDVNEKTDVHEVSNEPDVEPTGSLLNVESIIDEAIQKSVQDKMMAESALVLYAKDLFPQYIEKFEKFLPYTTSFDMAQKKVWDEFKELRNHPNAKTIEKHLSDFTFQRMFELNKIMIDLQKENLSLRNGNASMKQQLQRSQSDLIGLQSSYSNVTRELATERETSNMLQTKVEEYESDLAELQAEVEGIVANVEKLQSERDQLIVFRDENGALKSQLAYKTEEIGKINGILENMSKTASMTADAMNRMERDIESMNLKNDALTRDKEQSAIQLATLQEQLSTAQRINEGYVSKIKQLEAGVKQTVQTQPAHEESVYEVPAAFHTDFVETKAPVQVDEPAKSEAISAVETMDVGEANDALGEKIESIRSQIPPKPEIKVRPALDRGRLKAATSNLKKMSEGLSKPETK
jgi:hypothetical protein